MRSLGDVFPTAGRIGCSLNKQKERQGSIATTQCGFWSVNQATNRLALGNSPNTGEIIDHAHQHNVLSDIL